MDAASRTRFAKVAVKCVAFVYLANVPGVTACGARLECDHASFCLADVAGVRELAPYNV